MIRSTVNETIISATKANSVVRAKGESVELVSAGATTASNIEMNGSDTLLTVNSTHYSNGHNGSSE